MDKNILEEEDKPVATNKKIYIYIFIGLLLVLILILGMYYIFKVLPSKKIQPTPTPSSTEQVWKVKSEKNVMEFIDLWSKSLSPAGSEQYAFKAKDLLTNVAQAKLETYKDEKDKPITKVSEQLNKFIGLKEMPKSFDIFSTTKIDEKNVEVRVNISFNNTQNQARDLVFNNISEGGIWLIDSIVDKGTPTAPSPTPSPSTSSINNLSPSPAK